MKVITLTTDFGLMDWFVGAMKGVILKIAPNTQIIDITHDIPPQDIRTGAFALMCAYKYFPEGTVHVAVIDPEVGGKRLPIAVKTRSYWFVGPDNGVLSYALNQELVMDIRLIENPKICLERIGNTFHGRDIFAPAAANIVKGITPEFIGKKLRSFVDLGFPESKRTSEKMSGQIVYIDKFGNGITNIRFNNVNEFHGWRVIVGRKTIAKVMDCYAAVAAGEPVAIPGSSGYIEIAVRNGNAAKKLNLKIGTKVQLFKSM